MTENIRTVYIVLGVVAGLLWAGVLAWLGAPTWFTILSAITLALIVAIFSISVERGNKG